MVKHIRNSPKRREAFYECQQHPRPINLVLSVPTRWNSTWLMLTRFRRLKAAIIDYIHTYGDEESLVSFSRAQWRHIDYLIEILHPFYTYTCVISRMKNTPTIHLVIRVFDGLLGHLDKYIDRLSSKTTEWKQSLRVALIASRDKLHSYLERMVDGRSDVYGLTMLLDPQAKLEGFSEMTLDIINARNVSVYYFDYYNYILIALGPRIPW